MAYGGENGGGVGGAVAAATGLPMGGGAGGQGAQLIGASADGDGQGGSRRTNLENMRQTSQIDRVSGRDIGNRDMLILAGSFIPCVLQTRSEEHTSELQSLMRISYAVFCLKKKHNTLNTRIQTEN